MPKTSVRDILREIESLPEADQFALEQELARRLDVQWDREARQARERGIDQAAIDRAIDRRRHGP